jgi:hypothetical protein
MVADKENTRRVEEETIEIMLGLRQLRFNDDVVGSLAHDPHCSVNTGTQASGRTEDSTASSATLVPLYVDFTDSEDSDASDEMTAE